MIIEIRFIQQTLKNQMINKNQGKIPKNQRPNKNRSN